MLKMLGAAAVAVGLLAGPAHAEYLYQGFVKITVASKACTKGPKAGTLWKSHYHPGVVSGALQNWTGSAIDIYDNFASRAYQLGDGSFTSTAKTVTNRTLAATTLKTLKISKVSIGSQSPSLLSTTTTALTFSGKITNPLGLAGQETCVVNYLWAGHLRN